MLTDTDLTLKTTTIMSAIDAKEESVIITIIITKYNVHSYSVATNYYC